MKHILTFLIPTNKPEELTSKFYSCLPVLKPLRDYITFCFNFQPPCTSKQIEEIVSHIKQEGFEVAYTFNDYKWTPQTFSFVKMRNDAASIAPKDTMYFVDFDDDIVYYEDNVEIAQKIWLNALLYLIQRPEVGSLRIDTVCLSDSGLVAEEDRIYLCLSQSVRTGLGLIYKNIYKGNVLPKRMLGLIGSREDNLEIYQRVIDGYLAAVVVNSFIGEHTDFKPELSANTYGLRQYENNLNTCTTYKNKHWGDACAAFPYSPDVYSSSKNLSTKCDLDSTVSELVTRLDGAIDELLQKPPVKVGLKGRVYFDDEGNIIDNEEDIELNEPDSSNT